LEQKKHDEYLNKYLVIGYFHELVPTDIKDAWLTVEYMLAHAYYHYPMYDEGFKKALLIIEMAVKIKAKELGISLKTKLNNSVKVVDKKLSTITNEVFKAEHYKFLKQDIDRIRKLRNYQVHPESNSYMGVTCNMTNNLQLVVIVLNGIFKDENEYKRIYNESIITADSIRALNKNLLVLDYNKPSILIDQILDFKIDQGKLYLFINPVRKNILDILTNHYSVYPEILCLSDYALEDDEVKGVTSEGNMIRISKTKKQENHAIHRNYLTQIENQDKSEWEIFFHVLKQNTAWEMVRIIYENMESSKNRI
jgi:hypothetical protein